MHLAITFDESNPASCVISDAGARLIFDNPSRRPVDRAALLAAIQSQDAAKRVASIEIAPGSLMDSCWIVAAFPVLAELRIAGMRVASAAEVAGLKGLSRLSVLIPEPRGFSLEFLPKLGLETLSVEVARKDDVLHISQCATVHDLEVSSWPEKDLVALSRLALERLAVSGGALESTAGLEKLRLEELRFTGCKKLKALSTFSAERVEVSGCNALNTASFRHVHDLRVLRLAKLRLLADAGFVVGCHDLEELELSAGRVEMQSVTPFVGSLTLRRLRLCPKFTDEQVAEIATRNPSLAVTNGEVYYVRGRRTTERKFSTFRW